MSIKFLLDICRTGFIYLLLTVNSLCFFLEWFTQNCFFPILQFVMSLISSSPATIKAFPSSKIDVFSSQVCDEDFMSINEDEFKMNKSSGLMKPKTQISLRRLKSLNTKKTTVLNIEDKDQEKIIENLSLENSECATSLADSTEFLLDRLEKNDKFLSKNKLSENSENLPKVTPILKTEVRPEELSANHVPTILPYEFQDSPFSSESDLSTGSPPSFSPGKSLYIEELESISSVYESLPDWEFWCTTVQDYSGVARRTPHLLSNKIRLGIPSVLRGTLWQTMSQSASTHLETVYHQLLDEKDFIYEKIIQRDIPRTFPRLSMFSEEGGVGQTRLFNVLKAYSLYDSEVGYCQGLGFMVGPLLINLPEVEAFCVFIRLMETYDMRSMFTVKMEGLRLRLYQLGNLISELLPNLANHLASFNISTALYASQWFLSLFAYTFPLPLVQRIYDVVFAEGAPETIMRVALALLQKNEASLLAMKEFEEIISFLSSPQLYEVYNNSATKLINDAIALSTQVSKKKLDELASSYSKEPNSEVFCKQKTSYPRKSGWINDTLFSLYYDRTFYSRSLSKTKPSGLLDSPNIEAPAFFMNPENSTASKLIRRKTSSAQSMPDTEIEVLRHAVHDLQTTTESHLTALTQLRQDHTQLKSEMVYLKSDKFTLQEENELLRHELNKLRSEGIKFQQQSRSTLLRQQEYIQVVEKQLLDANMRLKNLQDERDQLQIALEYSRPISNSGSPDQQSNLSSAFRRFLSKS